MKETLIIIRNFLYRLFLIGAIFSLIPQLAILSTKFQGIEEAAKILHTSPNYLAELILTSITIVKNILLFGILCPALALHWTIARDKF